MVDVQQMFPLIAAIGLSAQTTAPVIPAPRHGAFLLRGGQAQRAAFTFLPPRYFNELLEDGQFIKKTGLYISQLQRLKGHDLV